MANFVGSDIRKSEQHCAEANCRQDEAPQIELESGNVCRFTQQREAEEYSQDAYRHVERENHPPVDVFDQVAAKCWPKHWRQHERQTKKAHHRVASLRRHHLKEHGHAKRAHHSAAQTLDHSKGDQAGVVPGQAAQQRAAREQGHRDQVQALGAERVRQVASSWHDDRQRQHVTGDDELRLVHAYAEDRGDLGQRDVHDRLVEHDHERADDRAHQHLPLVVEPVQQPADAEAREGRNG